MSTQEISRARASDPDRIPRYAMTGLLLVIVCVSAAGWISTLPSLAGWIAASLAACLEALIFYGLPKALRHWKDNKRARLGVLCLVLVMAGAINAVGVDRGLALLASPLQGPLDAVHARAVDELDDRRKDLEDEIKGIEGRLLLAQAGMPDPEATSAARQRAWLANYNASTAVDQRRLPEARSALAALPARAAPAEHAYPEWLRHLIAAGLFFISMFTRFAWGLEAAPHSPRKAPRPRINEAPLPHADEAPLSHENVLNFQQERRARRQRWSADDRENVRRLKGTGLSDRAIAKETGIPHQTVSRWT